MRNKNKAKWLAIKLKCRSAIRTTAQCEYPVVSKNFFPGEINVVGTIVMINARHPERRQWNTYINTLYVNVGEESSGERLQMNEWY